MCLRCLVVPLLPCALLSFPHHQQWVSLWSGMGKPGVPKTNSGLTYVHINWKAVEGSCLGCTGWTLDQSLQTELRIANMHFFLLSFYLRGKMDSLVSSHGFKIFVSLFFLQIEYTDLKNWDEKSQLIVLYNLFSLTGSPASFLLALISASLSGSLADPLKL